MIEHLYHKLSVLHQHLLHGKLPRSLHWSDAVELIGHLGEVQAQGGNEFAFVVGRRRELFKRPHTPEFGIKELSRLRKFLKDAGSESAPPTFAQPCRMVVVIDHHAAHMFRDQGGTRPTKQITIEPCDPHHFHHHFVLIGHGIGKSSAVAVLAEHLRNHHGELSRRVKAMETADLSALTAPEIKAIAKRHMITVV